MREADEHAASSALVSVRCPRRCPTRRRPRTSRMRAGWRKSTSRTSHGGEPYRSMVMHRGPWGVECPVHGGDWRHDPPHGELGNWRARRPLN
jgi:hypothetical protein